jgi:hypothetical protein
MGKEKKFKLQEIDMTKIFEKKDITYHTAAEYQKQIVLLEKAIKDVIPLTGKAFITEELEKLVYTFDIEDLYRGYSNNPIECKASLSSVLLKIRIACDFDRYLSTNQVESLEYVININESIEKFHDIYGKILSMDKRSSPEENINIHNEQHLEKSNENLMINAKKFIAEILPLFQQVSDSLPENHVKKFFSVMPRVESDSLVNKITIQKPFEPAVETQPKPSGFLRQYTTQQNSSKEEKKVELTEDDHNHALHTVFQNEAETMVKLAKLICFEQSVSMQSLVMEQCLGMQKEIDHGKCEQYNRMADLAVKNCAYIFPMHTDFDQEIYKDLSHAVSGENIITSIHDYSSVEVDVYDGSTNASPSQLLLPH